MAATQLVKHVLRSLWPPFRPRRMPGAKTSLLGQRSRLRLESFSMGAARLLVMSANGSLFVHGGHFEAHPLRPLWFLGSLPGANRFSRDGWKT